MSQCNEVDVILLSNTPGNHICASDWHVFYNQKFLFPPIIQALVAIYVTKGAYITKIEKKNWEGGCTEFHPGTKEEEVKDLDVYTAWKDHVLL